MRRISIFALMLVLWPATALAGSSGPTVCPSGCAFQTIGAAIAAANPGDTIAIASGVYPEHVRINKDLTLEGPGATIDGGGDAIRHSVIIVDRGIDATIDGLTITNGDSPDFGGGILNYGHLTVENSQITNNQAAADGGGIYNNGVLVLSDSQVLDNASAGPNGAISNDLGSVDVSSTLIANNTGGTCTGPNCRD